MFGVCLGLGLEFWMDGVLRIIIIAIIILIVLLTIIIALIFSFYLRRGAPHLSRFHMYINSHYRL